MVDRKAFLYLAGMSAAMLAGCSSGNSGSPGSEPAGSDQKAAESSPKKGAVGEEIGYVSAQGDGDFTVTVNGLERSADMTDSFAYYGDVAEGYTVCVLLLTIENVNVELYGDMTSLSKVWLEDADGITMSPMNSAYGYGEYEAAPDGTFSAAVGQAVRIAVPYQLPDGNTSYTVMVDGTEVPVELVDGDRPVV